MSEQLWPRTPYPAATIVLNRELDVRTGERVQFLDITEFVESLVAESGVVHGTVNVQTLHTTTGIVVNENEPLLLRDFKELLIRLAPRNASYHHNRLEIRTENMGPDERMNGDAHARALFLRTSESLNVVDGAIRLGQWQRIFFAELDGAQDRKISVTIMGQGQARAPRQQRSNPLPILLEAVR